MTQNDRMMPVRERLAVAVRAIGPVLNRVVLAGPPVVELLMSDPAVRTPALSFAEDATLLLLSTSMVDRLGLDLQQLGLERVGRSDTGDRWRLAEGVTFDLMQVRTDEGDHGHAWFEYATLLTLPLSVGDGSVVRIAGAPAMLALELAAFSDSGSRPLESAELERVVMLIAGRQEIERECAAAPPELRTMIARSLARLARHDALQLLVRRALSDAMMLPELATRIRERMLRIAC